MLSEIKKNRKKQLELQERIDEKLKKLNCKEIVANYLIQQRELNRKLTNEYYDASLFDFFEIAKKHLSLIEKENNKVYNILLEPNSCCNLMKLL